IVLGRTRKPSGSDTICAPTGTTVDGRPLKVTGRAVSGWIADTPAWPPAGRATETAVIGSAAPPNALENRSRRFDPPTVTRTVWRNVVSAMTRPSSVNGGGGMLPGSVSCGIEVQVLTQPPAATGDPFAATECGASPTETASTPARPTTNRLPRMAPSPPAVSMLVTEPVSENYRKSSALAGT